MRGNHSANIPLAARQRSIPAYAGEPANVATALVEITVYPRVCGGTRPWPMASTPPMGLSPRMRGNQLAIIAAPCDGGSIPAYAGEPRTERRRHGQVRVYPRVCGGTQQRRRLSGDAQGLSPRMRGNREPGYGAHRYARSIPAYAGEPLPDLPVRWGITVYPRVCGGTAQLRRSKPDKLGLSPRMRGNPS